MPISYQNGARIIVNLESVDSNPSGVPSGIPTRKARKRIVHYADVWPVRVDSRACVYALSFFRLQLPVQRDVTDFQHRCNRPMPIHRISVHRDKSPSSAILARWKGRLIVRSIIRSASNIRTCRSLTSWFFANIN